MYLCICVCISIVKCDLYSVDTKTYCLSQIYSESLFWIIKKIVKHFLNCYPHDDFRLPNDLPPKPGKHHPVFNR